MKRVCNKGFIVMPSETDGKNVPFFITVRDKDIIWDEKTLGELELVNISKLGENRSVQYPMARWTFEKDGWDIDLYSNGQINMRKKVAIVNNSTVLISSSEISSNISLPIKIKADKTNIQITNSGTDNSIKTGIVNATTDIGREMIDDVNISIVNTFFQFDTNLRTYNEDYLYVSITSYVK